MDGRRTVTKRTIMEPNPHRSRAVHHSAVHGESLNFLLGIRCGSGSVNNDRETPSRGSSDSDKVVLAGREGGGDVSKKGGGSEESDERPDVGEELSEDCGDRERGEGMLRVLSGDGFRD